MRSRVIGWKMQVDGDYVSEVELENGAKFRTHVPAQSLGAEVEILPNGSIEITTADGKVLPTNPVWLRAPDPEGSAG